MGVRTGTAIVRSAPWLALLAVAAAAAGLLTIAVLARHTGVVLPLILLGVAASGGVGGYLLDEEAAEVADATPTSRPRRLAWRIALAPMPLAIVLVALVALDRLDPATHWLRLSPVAVGSVATGIAGAAALRRSGIPAPGDQASVLALGATVLVVAAEPLRKWVSLVPLDSASYPSRTVVAWTSTVVACGVLTIVCERDPGGSRVLAHRRGSDRRRPLDPRRKEDP